MCANLSLYQGYIKVDKLFKIMLKNSSSVSPASLAQCGPGGDQIFEMRPFYANRTFRGLQSWCRLGTLEGWSTWVKREKALAL